MWIAQSSVSALLLGFGLNQRWGYAAGDHDHHVLSPLGMQWAKPEWFANDWTIENAPQPHVLFDLITWFGTKTGTLAGIYLLFFVASMLVYGLATTLLAQKWAPRYPWSAVLSVTALTAVAPLYLLGSGAIMWPVALPGVLGGILLYLVTASLILGRNRLAAVAGIAVAVVHVQVGVIVVVLLALVAALNLWRDRRREPALIIGAVTALGISFFELRLRPVAGNIGDFARICDELIPYHCNASVWPLKSIAGGLAVMALSLLIYFYLGRQDRFRWAVIFLLPAAGLFAALIADVLNIAGLGVLVQGVNVYRLAVIFIPYLAWGMVAPVFAQVGPRVRWGLLGAVLVLWYMSLRVGGWGLTIKLIEADHWFFGVIIALVAGCVAITVPGVVARPDRLRRLASLLLVAACFSSAYEGISDIWVRTFEPGLLERRPVLMSWGQQVEKTVPPGEIIVMPPTMTEARMATKRAVIADCKYGPYGGDAYLEYSQRMSDLGGIKQCTGRDGEERGYSDLTADELEAVAEKYGAQFLALLPRQSWQQYQLRQRGWTIIVPASDPANISLQDRDKHVNVSILRAPAL